MIHRTWHRNSHSLSFQNWYSDLLDTYKRERPFLKGNKLHIANILGIQKYILSQDLPNEDQSLRNLVIDAMMSCSQSIPGSEIWLPYTLSDDLIIWDHKYTSSSNIVDLVSKYASTPEIEELFRKTLELSGPLTKISVRLGDYNQSFIQYKSSYSFPVFPCPMFTQTLGKAKGYEFVNPEVFMIEGAPATLAEIEPLIYRQVESGRPIVIIARHYPEEVSATLATNFKTSKLRILPLVYGNDISSVNLASDMMCVAGGELVSKQFGDIISAACSDDAKYGEVQRIEVTDRGIDLDSDRSTTQHVKRLIEALEGAEEALQEVLGNRIHSLTNDSIVVHIPKSTPEIHQELDQLFKHYSSAVQTGLAKTQLGWLPSSIVNTANRIGQTTREELRKIGGFLLQSK